MEMRALRQTNVKSCWFGGMADEELLKASEVLAVN